MCNGCNHVTIDGVTYRQRVVNAGNCAVCKFYDPIGQSLATACTVSADDRFDCSFGAFEVLSECSCSSECEVPDGTL